MVYELKQAKKAGSLFGGWQESLIWSCLQGVMGKIYVDSLENPVSAIAVLGDFCFVAGKPDMEIVRFGLGYQDFIIMVPQDSRWEGLIESCKGSKIKKVIRYAIKKEPGIFDSKMLQEIASKVPDGYELITMDEPLFWHCREIAWCRDWVSNYDSYAAYEKHGLGVVIRKDGEPVSGACSYSGYEGGIEVEVGTKEGYRRKGLASICSAKLILECLGRGWYPSWDAQNKWSVALAEKLGYHFAHEYVAYEAIKEGA